MILIQTMEAHKRGIKTVAVSAGYITAQARQDFFAHMDAANIDLKAFTNQFYEWLCFARLEPVLETLRWLKHETKVWLEVTTLLIPGHNDSAEEIAWLYTWFMRNLGMEVPLHFTAFHPDFKRRMYLLRLQAPSSGPTSRCSKPEFDMSTPAMSIMWLDKVLIRNSSKNLRMTRKISSS